MNVKLRVLSAGAVFFMGASMLAQKKKSDTVTNAIEEVVILGTYGIKETQEQKVGSYSLVSAKALEKPVAISVDLAIAGQVSGAVISSNSGQPGSNAKVLIRGISSLTGDNQPLYIIDGVPVTSGDQAGVATSSNGLSLIDPSDIESVEVLKDGATTSLYGSRGASGVIIIKTKSGKGGRGKLTLNMEYGVGGVAYEKYTLLNAAQQKQALIMGYMSNGESLEKATASAQGILGWDGKTDTDWQKATRRSSTGLYKYGLNYSFGNEKIKGYASIGSTEQEGIIRDALYRRINATVKLNAKLSDKINVAFSNIISRGTQWGPLDYGYFANPVLSARFASPTSPIYNADGSYNFNIVTSAGEDFNPVAIQNINKRKSAVTKILSSFGLDYSILPNLRFSTNLGMDYNYYDESEYRNPDFGDGNNPTQGIIGLALQSDFAYTTLNWSNFLHYDWTINDDHKINVSAGTEYTQLWTKRSQAASTGFDSGHYEQNNLQWGPTPYMAWSYNESSHLIGLIGRASYGYKDLFNVMGSFRRDKYSHFGADKKEGNFWATGANVNLHKIGNIGNYFNELKVRASYGEVGNIGNIQYLSKPTLGVATYMLENGMAINNPGNTELGWETSKKYNIGLDLGFVQNRLKLSFDVYKNIVLDQLTTQVPNAPSTGFGNLVGNALEHESKGVESTISYDVFRKGDFNWSINANYGYNKSVVTKILGPYVGVEGFKRFMVGHNPTEWFLAHYAGVNSTNGDAQWYTNATHTALSNGSGTSASIVSDFTGKNALPAHTAGLTNSFSYKNFSLSFLLTYQGDFYVYDLWGRYMDNDGQGVKDNQVVDVLNAWTPTNTGATRPQFRAGNTVTKYHSTRYLYKGDNIKLKSAELGYKLNKDQLKIDGINNVYMYVRGVNLLTFAFDKNLPFDPESNSNHMGTIGGMGLYDQTMPLMRQFMVGATIDF
ncbi:SusC/RagA family TonB-linked outer membrane protein [Soonwooa sp.]|uniref:SusC/RagA family TonB-linked outer membrane protein n=1 Tax=Soonwooa sp. TaxID=1938592 RepID=UPI0028ABC564|nr:SusC/RagA family TonB-linked outer membrane protein [Soonwooa sp.]